MPEPGDENERPLNLGFAPRLKMAVQKETPPKQSLDGAPNRYG